MLCSCPLCAGNGGFIAESISTTSQVSAAQAAASSVVDDYTALLSGNWYWGTPYQGAPQRKGAFVTFSFAESFPAYHDNTQVPLDDPGYFRALSATERDVFRQSIQDWASQSGLIALELKSGQRGDIEAGVYDLQAQKAGQAYFPDAGTYLKADGSIGTYLYRSAQSGKIFLDKEYGLTKHVMLHEIGHALGLKHPFDTTPTLNTVFDTGSNTVMSYNLPLSNTLGNLDIQAIQAIYGTNNADGKQISSWNWDANTETLTQVGSINTEQIYGTSAKDVIYANGGKDIIVTYDGDDIVYISASGEDVNVGLGFDTSYLAGNRKDYTVNFYEATVDGASRYDYAYFYIYKNNILTKICGAEKLIFGSGEQESILDYTDTNKTADALGSLQVFRFYNNKTGTHFFSANEAETLSVIQNLQDYTLEGVAFRTAKITDAGQIDIYRLYNTQNNTHFYTKDKAEVDYIRANLPQYNYEGVAYRSYDADAGPQEEVYRFYNKTAGSHFFTVSEAERDSIINTLPNYQYEGVAYWVLV